MRALNRNTALLRTVQVQYLHSKGCAGADAVPQLPHSLPPLLQFSSQGTNNRTCFWEERVRAWINGCATEVFVSTHSFFLPLIYFLLDLLAQGSIWWCAVHLVAAHCELTTQANLAPSSFTSAVVLLAALPPYEVFILICKRELSEKWIQWSEYTFSLVS